jgi:VWFA-related protein
MRKIIWIGPIFLSLAIMSFEVNSARPQIPDPVQVLQKETAHSVREWRGAFSTYKDFDLNACTLNFRTSTLPRDGLNNAAKYPPEIYKFSFPLQSLDVRPERLATQNSFVLSFSGPGSLTIEKATPSVFFETKLKRNWPAPNVSIPFESEESAKRAMNALQHAMDACRIKEDPVQIMNGPVSPVREELSADVSHEKHAIKVNVDLVTVDVTVIGDKVPELKAEDFVVYDNKIAQEISNFSHDLPISVAFVLEPIDAAMGYPEMNLAALSALRLLNPGDQTALYSLTGDRLGILTDDRLRMAELISFFGANAHPYALDIFGTLYDAARYLKQQVSGRRAIILISKNSHLPSVSDDKARWLTTTSSGKKEVDNIIEKTRIELLESAVTLYAMTPDEVWLRNGLYGYKIKSIAEDTGGEMIVAGATTKGRLGRSVAPIGVLHQVMDRLRAQYTIGFTPSNPGEKGSFHELTVRLANQDRCPKCGIKARKGYYAGISAPFPPVRKPQAKPLQSLSEIDNKLIQESILLAGTCYFDMNDISFALRNAEKITSTSGQNQMMIELSVDPAGIEMAVSGERRTFRIQAAMFYSDKEGNLLGSNVWKIQGSLSEEDLDRAKREGIPFSARIPIIADNQILRIVLYDEISGRIASKFTQKKGKGLAIVKQDLNHFPGPTNGRLLIPDPGPAIGSGEPIDLYPGLRR